MSALSNFCLFVVYFDRHDIDEAAQSSGLFNRLICTLNNFHMLGCLLLFVSH